MSEGCTSRCAVLTQTPLCIYPEARIEMGATRSFTAVLLSLLLRTKGAQEAGELVALLRRVLREKEADDAQSCRRREEGLHWGEQNRKGMYFAVEREGHPDDQVDGAGVEKGSRHPGHDELRRNSDAAHPQR